MLTKSDINQIESVVSKSVSKGLDNFATKKDLKNEVSSIKKDVAEIRRDVKTLINL